MHIKQMAYAIAGGLMMLLPGCASDTPSGMEGGNGRILLRVGVDGTVQDAVPSVRSSQASKIPDSSELNLKLTKKDGSQTTTWGSIAEFPTDKGFSVGAYTLEAYYGSMEIEGFDAPYFYGITDVNVAEGSENEAHVTASLANTMVSIDYTDAFRNYFKAYSAQIHSEGGDYISFMSDEERPAYLRPGNITVTVSITKQNGLSASIEAATFQASGRHHYHVILDVNNGETGEGVLQVKFDDSIVTEDVDIDISDAVMMMPAPTVSTTGFVSGEPVHVLEGINPGSMNMTVSAPAGLRSAVLTTHSDALVSKGFPAEIDLMQASEAQQALLKSFGLEAKGLYNRPDKMAVIDFSKLLAGISATGEHSFTLVAKDKLGKVNLPVTLTANTKLVSMAITSIPDIRIDETEAELSATYDGENFTDNVTLQLQAVNGDWIRPAIISHTTEGNTHKLRFRVPADHCNFPVRLNYGDKTKATSTLRKTGVILSAEDVDVWATHATFSVDKNVATPLSAISYYYSADGFTFTQVTGVKTNTDGTVTLSGLPSGKGLKVKASDTQSLSDAYRTCNITTETEVQPENGNMDSWSRDNGWSKAAAAYKNTIYNYFPAATATDNQYWATRNALTTNKAFGYTSMWYNYYAGTYNVAGLNNTQAAEICTVGWARNKANTFVSGGGNCNETSAGYLFMGSYTYDHSTNTETFDFGRPFTSRPDALTFMYKFASVNNESFKAYAVVENRTGGKTTELGRGELVSSAEQSNFTKATVKINYSNTKLKATHAYIVFISSTADTPGKKAVQGSKNAFQGYTDARYIGNVLNVDNIEFTY